MEKQQITPSTRPLQVSGKTAILTSVAGLIIGGPLLGLMGISFLATMTLLTVATPLFIIFSPVLFGAAFVFALVMLGFAAAGTMAVAGLSAVAWVLRSFTTSTRAGISDKMIASPDDVVEGERGKDIQHKPYDHHRENLLINRA